MISNGTKFDSSDAVPEEVAIRVRDLVVGKVIALRALVAVACDDRARDTAAQYAAAMLEPADIVESLRDRKEARSRGCEVCNWPPRRGPGTRSAVAPVAGSTAEVVGEQWAATAGRAGGSGGMTAAASDGTAKAPETPSAMVDGEQVSGEMT